MKSFLVAILAALALPAHAEFWSGTTLMSRLTSNDRAENAQAADKLLTH